MIKQLSKSLAQKMGFKISRIDKTLLRVSELLITPEVDDKVVDQIFDFFKRVPPFYDDSVRLELKIAGAWRSDFYQRRKNQLDFIDRVNKHAYKSLLKLMLRNELIAGQWAISYYDQNLIGDLTHLPLPCVAVTCQ